MRARSDQVLGGAFSEENGQGFDPPFRIAIPVPGLSPSVAHREGCLAVVDAAARGKSRGSRLAPPADRADGPTLHVP